MQMFDRLLVLGLLFSICSISAIPQAASESTKEGDLYSIALAASLAEIQKQWGHIDDSMDGRVRTDYTHIPVVKNPEITDDLPADFGAFHVEYLDQQAILERCRRAGKEFAILQIGSAHNEGARLRVQVSVSWVQRYKRGLAFGFSDWSDVYFQYDCAKHSFTISEVKLGGI